MRYQPYLTIEEIFESIVFKNNKAKESLENFRDEHCDMCFHYKDIVSIIENLNEYGDREDLNKTIDKIYDIATQHTSYWVEE